MFGQKAVEKDLQKTLPKMKTTMEQFVKLETVETLRQKKGKATIVETVPMVSIDNFKEFCVMAMAERGLDPSETDIIIGADDGGGTNKVIFTYFLIFSAHELIKIHRLVPIVCKFSFFFSSPKIWLSTITYHFKQSDW